MITGPGYSKDTAHSAACPKKFLQALVKPVKDSAGSWPRLTTYDRYGRPAVVQLSIQTAAGNRTPIQGAAFFDFNQGVVHPSSPAATRQPMGCQPVNQGVVHPSSPAPTRQPMGCRPVYAGCHPSTNGLSTRQPRVCQPVFTADQLEAWCMGRRMVRWSLPVELQLPLGWQPLLT